MENQLINIQTSTQKKNTYYHLVLDKSGSMQDCWKEAQQVINSHIQELRRIQNENPSNQIFFSLCIFNETLLFPLGIARIDNATIDWSTIYPDGMTALYDAIGESIEFVKNQAGEGLRTNDSDVIMLILTDGLENASKIYSGKAIKQLLEAYEQTGNWHFLFLGAGLNINEATHEFQRGNRNSHSFSKSQFQKTFALMDDEIEEFIKSKSEDTKKKNFFDKQ